jgi:hypothetical protein
MLVITFLVMAFLIEKYFVKKKDTLSVKLLIYPVFMLFGMSVYLIVFVFTKVFIMLVNMI